MARIAQKTSGGKFQHQTEKRTPPPPLYATAPSPMTAYKRPPSPELNVTAAQQLEQN